MITYYVTVYKPMAGWKAVLMDTEGNPIETGFFAYDKKEKAIKDAKCWAKCEEIPYYDEREVN